MSGSKDTQNKPIKDEKCTSRKTTNSNIVQGSKQSTGTYTKLTSTNLLTTEEKASNNMNVWINNANVALSGESGKSANTKLFSKKGNCDLEVFTKCVEKLIKKLNFTSKDKIISLCKIIKDKKSKLTKSDVSQFTGVTTGLSTKGLELVLREAFLCLFRLLGISIGVNIPKNHSSQKLADDSGEKAMPSATLNSSTTDPKNAIKDMTNNSASSSTVTQKNSNNEKSIVNRRSVQYSNGTIFHKKTQTRKNAVTNNSDDNSKQHKTTTKNNTNK